MKKRFRISTADGWSVIVWFGFMADTLDCGSYYFKFSDERGIHRDIWSKTEEDLFAGFISDFSEEDYTIEEI